MILIKDRHAFAKATKPGALSGTMILIKDRHHQNDLVCLSFYNSETMILIKDRHVANVLQIAIYDMGNMILIKNRHMIACGVRLT